MLGRLQFAVAAVFVTITLLAVLSTQGSAATTMQGDADCNQTVNALDALQILRGAASLGAADCVSSANVDCQNGANIVDALLILRYAAGLPATIDPAVCLSIGASPTPTTLTHSPTPTPTHLPTPTPTPSSDDPVIAAAGDVACPSSTPGTTSCRQQHTADLINAMNPDDVLMLGDAQYETGTTANLAAYYNPTWGQFLNKTWATAGGSHDFYGSGDWYTYFGGRAGSAPFANYSFDLGQWHVISMNSYCADAAHPTGGSCAAGSPGYNWLQNDLTTHANQCTLVFWHKPRWSSGTTHGSDATLAPYFQLLYDHNVDLLLVGHEHMYERFAPQNPGGGLDEARGIRELVVGTGGRSVYGIGSPIANSEVLNNTTFGVLKLTLHSNKYNWQFVPVAGQTFTDSGTQSCH